MGRQSVGKLLLAVIVIGALIRVGAAGWIAHADPGAAQDVDSIGYLGPAAALVDAGHFSLSPDDPTPMYFRTPGYPAFLAPILWLTDSVSAVSPIQAAFSLLAVAAIALVGWRLVGPTVGLVAGALVVLDPLQFAAAGTIMTESVSTVAVVALVAIGAVVFAARRPADVRPGIVFALGAAVAVAALVRPTYWAYPALLLAFLAIRFRSLPRRAMLARLAVFALPVIAVVGGWQLRNHDAVDSWQLAGANGFNLYCVDAAQAEARAEGSDLDTIRARWGCPKHRETGDSCTVTTAGMGCWMPNPEAPGQGWDDWGRRGVEIMREHPAQSARIMVEGVVAQVAGPGDATVGDYLGIGPSLPFTGALFLWNAALWAFATVGAVVGLRSRYRLFWLFVVATIGYTILVSTGGFAFARFRTPLVPLLALLAAFGLQHLARRFSAVRAPSSSVRADEPRHLARGHVGVGGDR